MTYSPGDVLDTAAQGTLIVVGTPIGNLEDLSPRALETLRSADAVFCEDTRHTGQLLSRLGAKAKRLVSFHAHNEATRIAMALELLKTGASIALVSDAGMPLVSDPGERLLAAAIEAGVRTSVVPGPSAGLAALVLSGLQLDRWRFEGFLPRKGAARARRLAEISAASYPSICYEAPQRIAETLADLERTCGQDRRVTVARELTKRFEEVWHGSLKQAVERSEAVAARGEHVLIVAGCAEQVSPEPDIRAALERLLDAGLGRREAVTAVTTLLGAAHNKAYAIALELAPK